MKILKIAVISLLATNLFAGAVQNSSHIRDNTNNIILDTRTRLVWSDTNATTKTWIDAIDYCENLTIGTFNNWRLPNIRELESISDDRAYNPATSTSFQNIQSNKYFSSSTFVGEPTKAWIIDFSYSASNFELKTNNLNVICVVDDDNKENVQATNNTLVTFQTSGETDSEYVYGDFDFENDGDKDIVTYTHSTSSAKIKLYKNIGNTLELYSTTLIPAYAKGHPYSLSNSHTVEDFNDDGFVDILVSFANHSNCSANKIRIYWGGHATTYFDTSDYKEFSLSSPYCVEAYGIDANNDNKYDVFIENVSSTDLLYLNNGDKSFSTSSTMNTDRDYRYTVEDFDNDGNQDMFAAKNGWADGKWGAWIHFGQGDGNFDLPVKQLTSINKTDVPFSFIANNDNYKDVVVSDNSNIFIGIFNDSQKNFTYTTIHSASNIRLKGIADWNKDGKKDILFQEYETINSVTTYDIKVILNNGDGTFANPLTLIENSSYSLVYVSNLANNSIQYIFGYNSADKNLKIIMNNNE